MKTFFNVLALASALAACTTTPKPPEQPVTVVKPNASIPFASFGGIYSWQARDDGSLILESNSHKFYRATFMGPCPELRFAGEAIGVKTGPLDSADRFSSIIVRGQTCPFASLDEVIDPKSKAVAAPTAPVEGRALPAPQ